MNKASGCFLLSGDKDLTLLTGPSRFGKMSFCKEVVAQMYETEALGGTSFARRCSEMERKLALICSM
jgi:hypothetical protein